jgi:predicted DNA-binding protein YlxM (UPF0122 family)
MKEIHENITKEDLEQRERRRREIELLRSRLKLLAGRDRVLMTMYLENGNSIRQIARLLCVTESKVARRIRRLTRRLIDSEYIECMRAREKFYEHQLRIAKDYFLTGLSVEKVAEKRRCSCYRVRKTLREIQSLVGNLQN